jgi:hypothetical protein
MTNTVMKVLKGVVLAVLTGLMIFSLSSEMCSVIFLVAKVAAEAKEPEQTCVSIYQSLFRKPFLAPKKKSKSANTTSATLVMDQEPNQGTNRTPAEPVVEPVRWFALKGFSVCNRPAPIVGEPVR